MGWGEYKIEVKGKEEANQLLIEMIKESLDCTRTIQNKFNKFLKTNHSCIELFIKK